MEANRKRLFYSISLVLGVSLVVGVTLFEKGVGFNAMLSKATEDPGYTIECDELAEKTGTFSCESTSGKSFEFAIDESSFSNTAKLTGLSNITFASTNEELTLLTGYDLANGYLYERQIYPGEENTFNIPLDGECYFMIKSSDELDITSASVSYSCTGNDTPVYDDFLTFTYDKDTEGYTVLARNKNNAKRVRIPAYYDDGDNGVHPVNVLGENCFSGNTLIDSIDLPSTIKIIEENAFRNQQNLKNIYLPYGIERIEKSAFSYCAKLEKIVFPESVTTIGETVLNECSYLQEVYFPKSITSLGNKPFSNCTKLEEVNCPEGLSKLPQNFLYNCVVITKFTIKTNITELQYRTIQQCLNLNMLIYEGTIEEFNAIDKKNGWLYECSNLKKITCSDGEINL